jgi:hypothetical protein
MQAIHAAVDTSPRPALPWLYVAILVGETAILVGLAAAFSPQPPLSYELGWAGAGSMLVMQVYSLRRRLRVLARCGSLRAWLDLHVFLGMQGFVFVAYHSIGIATHASLAALNFSLVATVVVAGLFGRYLYGFIPRARNGRALEHRELVGLLGDHAPPAALHRECRGLVDLIALDLARRNVLRAVDRDPAVANHRGRIRRSIELASQISGLEVAERWMSRWSLLHRPLAVLLLGITTLHVLAHFAYAA